MRSARITLLAAAVTLLAALIHTPARAAEVANPGFEDPITFDGAPFVGFWEGFSGLGTATAANAALTPRSGAQHLKLEIVASPNAFAGALQDIPNLTPGEVYVFSGWHMTPSDPLDVGIEVRIEWRNSTSDTEVSRTPNTNPVPTGTYTQFSLTAEVPEGADTGRLVYAIETFSVSPTSTGAVYVDDITFLTEGQTPLEGATWGGIKGLYR